MEVLIIENGEFGQIHILPIYLPPLEKRRKDIPLLVDTLYPSIELQQREKLNGVSPEALYFFMGYG